MAALHSQMANGDAMAEGDETEFTEFVRRIEPRLQQAMVARVGPSAASDAVAEALIYAWQHWSRVQTMDNPAGYLYRTAVSRSRVRRLRPAFPVPDQVGLPEVDPRLPAVMAALSERQRVAVFLVIACDWSYEQVAEWLDVSVSTVRNHLSRGLTRLREVLEVTSHA